MKKLALLILIPLFFSCNGRSSKPATDNAQPPADTVNTRNGAEHNEYNGNSPSFAELVSKIPITSLPFGVEGLDTITTYKPLGQSIDPIEWDTRNVHGLNDYYERSDEKLRIVAGTENADMLHDYHLKEGSIRFAKRFPPLKNGNEVLLVSEHLDDCHWKIIVCKPNDGRVVDSYDVFEQTDYYTTVSYIDKEYVLTKKGFEPPRAPGKISGLDIGDKVSDFVKKHGLTILVYSYKVNMNTRKYYHSKRYFWQNSVPVEFDTNSTTRQPFIVKGNDTIAINKNAEPTGVDAVK